MFDLKINIGHCDLYSMVQWFLPYILKTVWCTVQVKKNPHFLFFSMINCLFFWEKLGEIVENFSRFLQEIQYFLQEIPVFLPEILRFCL